MQRDGRHINHGGQAAAFRAGVRAYEAGEAKDSNPYATPKPGKRVAVHYRNRWSEGWSFGLAEKAQGRLELR